ncbi:MBL fold metallo-hydrolase [Clostridium beijerinckii]|uniref:MBL fold metallo-hydrolase n=1 Tax=Clostridium beijerinckii TaxID=1520 RepID=UPI0003D371F0|nr:MBL fold metallo-hydrolase [Clostridium beijerinckii]ALB45349.1 MBL fold metallo-hydrolase [Clostridium beijerinckii NRRL B-598]
MSKINVLDVFFNFSEQSDAIYPVILEDENEMILIDCGYPNFLSLIEEAALAKNINVKDLSKIIITHHDYDHMGALAEFKRKYPKVKVLASEEDAPYIDGSKKSLRLQQAENIYDSLSENEKVEADHFHKMLQSIESCNVDIKLKDRDYFDCCGGIGILATPGHMPGHISIYHKESKSLITGDALVVENGELVIAVPQYTLDMKEAQNSVKKFLDYDIERIICYHGGIFENEISDALKRVF